MRGRELTLEEKLQSEWLKSNRPNAYFETVTDKRTDNLIGIGVSYIDDEKKISDLIIKRRSIKDTKGGNNLSLFYEEW